MGRNANTGVMGQRAGSSACGLQQRGKIVYCIAKPQLPGCHRLLPCTAIGVQDRQMRQADTRQVGCGKDAVRQFGAGVSRSRKRYIRSRHVQKLSRPAILCSVMPAIARWKAWLCRFESAGSNADTSVSPCCGAAALHTPVICPSAMVILTCSAHPSGSKARSAKITMATPYV